MFCDKESVSFPTHYFLIIQNQLTDGLTALYSHKARFFNQSEYALYLNYNINGYIEHCFTSQVDCLLLWIGIIEKRWVPLFRFASEKARWYYGRYGWQGPINQSKAKENKKTKRVIEQGVLNEFRLSFGHVSKISFSSLNISNFQTSTSQDFHHQNR